MHESTAAARDRLPARNLARSVASSGACLSRQHSLLRCGCVLRWQQQPRIPEAGSSVSEPTSIVARCNSSRVEEAQARRGGQGTYQSLQRGSSPPDAESSAKRRTDLNWTASQLPRRIPGIPGPWARRTRGTREGKGRPGWLAQRDFTRIRKRSQAGLTAASKPHSEGVPPDKYNIRRIVERLSRTNRASASTRWAVNR